MHARCCGYFVILQRRLFCNLRACACTWRIALYMHAVNNYISFGLLVGVNIMLGKDWIWCLYMLGIASYQTQLLFH